MVSFFFLNERYKIHSSDKLENEFLKYIYASNQITFADDCVLCAVALPPVIMQRCGTMAPSCGYDLL